MTYNYHNNQLIRYKKTGKVYLLIQAFKSYFLVVDPEDKETPQPMKVILFKDIKYFCPDTEMDCKEIMPQGYWANYELEFKMRRQITL